jgi:polysaccharide export outer membrane protein
VIRSDSKHGGWRRVALHTLTGAALLVAARPFAAQTAGDAPNLADQCSGPLGALLPSCQGARTSIDLPSGWRPAPGVPSAPSVPGGRQAAEESRPALASAPVGPAEPPTEFQRFVASSIGQLLPIFGAGLFEKVPTTFAPLDRVPVTADYVIGPGDEILLRVWGQVNLDLALPVDRAGAVYIPQAGNVSVSGLQFKQLPDYLRSQLGRVFRNFDLSVNMGQLRSVQIFVMGQARRPGTYTVSSLSTLVNALFASGGPSSQGSMRRIQLKRGSQVAAELDLYDLLLKGDKSKDVRLLPEDVVYIPPIGPQAAAAGSLRNPAIYELKDEKTVGDLIQMAGGLSAVADRQRATLERIRERSSREVVELALDAAGMNSPVADGDVLQVLAIVPRFENTVTLRGNVASPGRFRWRPGMRLRDVIPDKESLITRDYWKKRNLLGYMPLEQAIAAEPAAEARRKPAETRIEAAAPDINWSYAVIERQSPRDLTTELLPFHLGRLVQEGDERQNLELQPGDVVTIFSQADIRVPQMQQNRFVRFEGEFHAAGVYAVGPGETLGQLIQRAGGLTPQAYLFGAEFLRESTRRDQQRRLDQFVQDLEREIEVTAANRQGGSATAEESAALAARLDSERRLVQRLRSIPATGRIVLNLDPGSTDISRIADLPLEDGDRFVVPARPATVNVLGAVYNQNAFIHEANLRAGDYLRAAGGGTRGADKGRMFIIRADGSVLPKQDRRFGSFKANFGKMRLNPGDSIVVPEQVLRTTLLGSLRDWSQVLFQFGLGAASINVLR